MYNDVTSLDVQYYNYSAVIMHSAIGTILNPNPNLTPHIQFFGDVITSFA